MLKLQKHNIEIIKNLKKISSISIGDLVGFYYVEKYPINLVSKSYGIVIDIEKWEKMEKRIKVRELNTNKLLTIINGYVTMESKIPK